MSSSNTTKYLRDMGTAPWLEIGEYTYGLWPAIHYWGEDARLKIGKFCSFADNVTIFLAGDHHIEWVTTYPFPAFADEWPEAKGFPALSVTKGDVVIGNDVWLGNDCVILSGVTIGDGAVIAARAVVTKDVAPYSIVGGNPAKHIRYRFSEEDIAHLLKLRWWDWDIEKIHANLHLLCSEGVKIGREEK